MLMGRSLKRSPGTGSLPVRAARSEVFRLPRSLARWSISKISVSKGSNVQMRRLVALFLVACGLGLAGCGSRGVGFDLQQNGLSIHTTVHRAKHRPNWRILTFAIRDAASGQTIDDAEVGVSEGGGATQRARNKGNGDYEMWLREPPGSSADVSVAVLAHNHSVIFYLRRP